MLREFLGFLSNSYLDFPKVEHLTNNIKYATI